MMTSTIGHQPIEWPSLLPINGSMSNSRMSWKLGSKVIVPAVGLMSKLWTDYFNTTRIHNHHVFVETLAKHYKNRAKRALITISNHSSCLDDPLMWGALIPFGWHLNSHRLRWSAAAQEVCFSCGWHSVFFSLGKTFPIIRGEGIYQPAMDFALGILKSGSWLHFFPQGKIVEKTDSNQSASHLNNGDAKSYQLKWGLARLILDHVTSNETSGDLEVLPLYHMGMDDLLPNIRPYVPRINKRVTFNVREKGPIFIDRNFLAELIGDNQIDSKSKRKKLMQFFEREMDSLKAETIRLHTNGLENLTT